MEEEKKNKKVVKKLVSPKKDTKKKTIKTTASKKGPNTIKSSKKESNVKTTKKVTNSKKTIDESKKNVKSEVASVEPDDTRLHLSPNKKVENRRLGILFGFVGIMLLIVLISCLVSNKNSSNIVNQVEAAINGENPAAIYIMRTGCSYCSLNETNITGMEGTYNAKFLKIDLADLTESDTKKLTSLLNVDSLGTPYLVVAQKGEIKDKIEGLTTYPKLFNFLKQYEIIDKEASLSLNYINYDDYKNLIKSKDKEVIVFAASTCHYCLSEHPILEQIARENNVKINYMYLDEEFNSDNDESQSKYNEFMSSLSWLKDNSDFGTPTILVVQNGEVKDTVAGYDEHDALVSFFQKNGLTK